MEIPQSMDSKFRYILVAAKRARQLQAGARPLVHTNFKKTAKIATAEIEAGLVPIELDSVAEVRSAGTKRRQ
ncbi:MAG: DNA-directed RNA polymerase subunit omega [Acidobacteriota bacterium]|nr:DNA-directed RNA polymerase subunit omega [Acidobacteriota bacterium]